MEKTEVAARVQEIKRSFRLMMDGATSASMRQKGLNYKLNWGASLVMLREEAAQMQKDYDLAIALWKEDVRECKILATMLMPPEKFLPEVADIWMEQTTSVEIAEQAAFNLYQHLSYAADKAFQWIASESEMAQLCGYHILSRLFTEKHVPSERGANELIDQASSTFQTSGLIVKKAIAQCLQKLADLMPEYLQQVNEIVNIY